MWLIIQWVDFLNLFYILKIRYFVETRGEPLHPAVCFDDVWEKTAGKLVDSQKGDLRSGIEIAPDETPAV